MVIDKVIFRIADIDEFYWMKFILTKKKITYILHQVVFKHNVNGVLKIDNTLST